MPLPPLQSGTAGMTRRHHLVEINRLRKSQYEPTKKQLEDEDLRLATVRQQEKQQKQQEWTQSRKVGRHAAAAASGATAGYDRPLPGAAVRSMRASGKAKSDEDTYTAQREEEAAKKREYTRLYDQEMKRQLQEREATVKKMRDEDEAQVAGLRQVNEEQDRQVALAHAQAREEERQYLARLKQTNDRELAAKKADREAREVQERHLQELVNENNRHRAETDERRQKNVTQMLRLQNEQFHKEATKTKQATEAKNNEEIAALAERNRRLAKEEQDAAQQKKEQFRREFEESIARDKEFRRTHNYDEPEDVTRRRDELAAQSYRVIREEDRLRDAERKLQYKQELFGQIQEKQAFRMTHLD